MKRFLASILMLVGVAYAAAPVSDVMTSDDAFALDRFMGPVALKRSLGSTLRHAHTTAYGVLDFSKQSGANGTLTLGLALPAKAILRQVFFDVVTAVSPAGTSISFKLLNAEDIKATTAAGSYTGILTSLVTGAPSTFLKTTSATDVSAVLTGSTATAGKIKVFADYVISE